MRPPDGNILAARLGVRYNKPIHQHDFLLWQRRGIRVSFPDKYRIAGLGKR